VNDAVLTARFTEVTWQPRSRAWLVAFAVTGTGTLGLAVLVTYTVTTGIGLWGNNIPVGWAFGIINFVWWIGIGHAGTFISAILLLLEQRWRTSINRIAEAMTIFAVMQAALFPLLHLGRPWFAYWLVPYPSETKAWPNFKSALPWDTAAVTTYFTISLVFWYLGMLPDLASVRDRAPGTWRARVYGVLALGWRGSVKSLRHYRIAYGLLAGLATPLVVSVHSIVSSDFATAILPGWHSTIFPPYFVAGAIFSGFAMVLTLVIPIRRAYRLHDVITERHLDNLAKLTLVTGWIVLFSYATEWYMAWWSGDPFERHQLFITRPDSFVFWVVIACNCVLPQLLWFRKIRRAPLALWLLSIAINVGMWSERFMLIVQSLEQDFLPSSWHGYRPTWVDWGILSGSICFFLFLFLAFLRLAPFVPLAELKAERAERAEEARA
jgi:molybdopterin-containing oxidoreductase family membrane subunit